ncbi:UV-endonuclease UvdE [Pseudovirgaria hyperparasitica]|uniref:UV-endonuclease UvdE n=1 Tax=Pseudovirgaria hyperparasitica TaxID=470096 RepID=A0A6A6VUD1_9PEZI|nr:UV-endonuclease UvdE [Pseudovirgaria hyperparasitica]KAF2752857.1 UV-endonuclease UvdE [Pseudovirgaria hyperparasitica]
MAKRKRSSAAGIEVGAGSTTAIPLPNGVNQARVSRTPIPPPKNDTTEPTLSRRSSRRSATNKSLFNPDENREIVDGPNALRASPDNEVNRNVAPKRVKREETPMSELSSLAESTEEAVAKKPKKASKPKKTVIDPTKNSHSSQNINNAVKKEPATPNVDPEDDALEEADEEELQEALTRPPPVNSSVLPLPWKGRLGFACLNTYLRYSNPPVFCSRTCRIASILEHRHPLVDPTQPEHATKNRPNKDLPADLRRGQKYVEDIGLANARDIIKMVRWNDRYGIRFMRLSSEMFPFASHEEYGYKLAPFASETLAEAGKVIAELGHRVTMHPGQFTQLGSPRKSVIDGSFRDLEFHDELLTLLNLPPQQDKDAVLILHMGGMFGDKAATLDRFRENYAKLSQSVKNRLVLENDDVIWSVHDLLPVCQELNIPLVLDYHHHNIIFDETKLREGTQDIIDLYPAITETWKRKGITQKMHYSEPTPAAITKRQRRKHSPRVMTMPPCPHDMDLMIEAKDKEQAVFELMRTFKLPGYETFNDIIPHVRNDDNKPVRAPKKKKTPKRKKKDSTAEEDVDDAEEEEPAPRIPIPEHEVGMGGPEGRVYWPPGMEEWLRPKKREVKKKEPDETPAAKKRRATTTTAMAASTSMKDEELPTETPVKSKKSATSNKAATKKTAPKKSVTKAIITPSTSDAEDVVSEPPSDLSAEDEPASSRAKGKGTATAPKRRSVRANKAAVSYADGDD